MKNPHPASPASRPSTYTAEVGLANRQVTSIVQDREDNFWFGVLGGGGVIRYDGRTFRIKN